MWLDKTAFKQILNLMGFMLVKRTTTDTTASFYITTRQSKTHPSVDNTNDTFKFKTFELTKNND